MDEGELRLRVADEVDRVRPGDLQVSDRVELYSEYYDQAFTVEITHKHDDEIGGDVVETNVDDPMISKRDIIHFKPEHVQSLSRGTPA